MTAFVNSTITGEPSLCFSEAEAKAAMQETLAELRATGYYPLAEIDKALAYLNTLWDEAQDFAWVIDGFKLSIETHDSRKAFVAGDPKTVAAYLPANYEVTDLLPGDGDVSDITVVQGFDSHGWTLDGYVIPRLLSGGMGAREGEITA